MEMKLCMWVHPITMDTCVSLTPIRHRMCDRQCPNPSFWRCRDVGSLCKKTRILALAIHIRCRMRMQFCMWVHPINIESCAMSHPHPTPNVCMHASPNSVHITYTLNPCPYDVRSDLYQIFKKNHNATLIGRTKFLVFIWFCIQWAMV